MKQQRSVQASKLWRLPFLVLLAFCMHAGKEGDVGVAGSSLKFVLQAWPQGDSLGGGNSIQELSKNP